MPLALWVSIRCDGVSDSCSDQVIKAVFGVSEPGEVGGNLLPVLDQAVDVAADRELWKRQTPDEADHCEARLGRNGQRGMGL